MGTATQLLSELCPYAKSAGVETDVKVWPQSPRLLSRLLKKHTQDLAVAGITWHSARTARQRTIILSLREPVLPQTDDCLDDATNYDVDRSTRARVNYCRQERARIKADAQAEKERRARMGCVVYSRGSQGKYSGW